MRLSRLVTSTAILIVVIKGRVLLQSPAATIEALCPPVDPISVPSKISDVNNDSSSSFSARALHWEPKSIADDELWAKYVAKGHHLKCIMQAPDKGAGWLIKDTRKPPSAASLWTGDLVETRKTWYWHESSVYQESDCDFEDRKLKAAFEGVGLSPKPSGPPANGDNVCYKIEHADETVEMNPLEPDKPHKEIIEQEYHVDGKKYIATGGYYWFSLNQKGGAIIGMNLDSPHESAKDNWEREDVSNDELPRLRFCSDIYWGYWYRDNPDVKNLHVYGAYNIVNDDASKLVARSLTDNGHHTLVPWPGVSFDIMSSEGQALVGSPIGATAAHLLTSHKAELGIKWIKKVTIFTEDAPPDRKVQKNKLIHMFFHIEDVPVEEVTDPQKEKDKSKDNDKVHTSKENQERGYLQYRIVLEHSKGIYYTRKHIFQLR